MLSTAQIMLLIAKGREADFYNGRAWRRLAKTVLKEQRYECQLCRQAGKYSRATTVHHVQRLKAHPELAYSRTYRDQQGRERPQLIALCRACHEKEHGRLCTSLQRGFFNQEQW